MKINYKNDYISIKEFNSVEIPDFTVLTGSNGSGKTHLLEAIKKGEIEVEGIDRTEIVYYNQNDFAIFTGDVKNIDDRHELEREWKSSTQSILLRIDRIKDKVSSVSHQKKSHPDSVILYTIEKPGYNFDNWLNLADDYANLKEFGEKNAKDRFSEKFYNFISHYLMEGDINDIEPDLLKEKFKKMEAEFENDLCTEDEAFYQFLKIAVPHKSFSEITPSDFESPHFFLSQLAQEEKEYQILKYQNILDKARHVDLKENIEYLDSEAFISFYGHSPIEHINKVLEEYECNNYSIDYNSPTSQLGLDRESMKMDIFLRHKDYITDFDQVSSGEKMLIALSLLIYKCQRNKIIPRVLLLDEIDSSLHPSMIQRLLDVIQNIFIKKKGLKIILATHSPTTVALSPEESIFVVNKEGVEKITKQSKVAAMDILTEGFVTLNEETELGIEYGISHTDLPVLFTEGITDKIIIETAWKKLYNKKMPFYIQECFDAKFLANLYSRGNDAQDGIFANYKDKKFIALFDFDTEGYNAWNGLNKHLGETFEDNPFKCLTRCNNTKNAYAMLLPVPSNIDLHAQIMKDEVKTFENESCLSIELLFYGISSVDEFFTEEKKSGGGKSIIINKSNKRKFANQVKKLNKEDFNMFIPIFDKVKEIIMMN